MSESQRKLVIGLGNPGRRYESTRHNVGFDVLDGFAAHVNADRLKDRFNSELAEFRSAETRVLLVKPFTFMNLSGRAARQLVDFYDIPLDNILVVCDDINLPLGKLRARAKGSAGGHNGLKNITNHLGSQEYSRLRVGVGEPGGADTVDHVLDRFKPGERKIIEDAVILAAQAVGVWISQGIEECMNRYNSG